MVPHWREQQQQMRPPFCTSDLVCVCVCVSEREKERERESARARIENIFYL